MKKPSEFTTKTSNQTSPRTFGMMYTWLARSSASITHVMRSEALTQINRLVAAFPEYTVDGLTSNSQNVIGEYGNYRPPYPDNCISFYDFSTPSNETLAAYGCTADTYGLDLLQWHGIKHDLTAGTKQAKFVFSQNRHIPNKSTNGTANQQVCLLGANTQCRWVGLPVGRYLRHQHH